MDLHHAYIYICYVSFKNGYNVYIKIINLYIIELIHSKSIYRIKITPLNVIKSI